MKIYHLISSITSISVMLSLSNCGKSDDKAAEAPKPEVPKTEAPKVETPKAAAPTPVAAAPAAPAPAPAAAPAAPAKMDEKAAIAKFEAELKVTKAAAEAIMKENEKAGAENPLAAMVPMKTLCGKMQEIKGEGLPPDLKEAWSGLVASFAKMSELFKDFPDKTADLTAWTTKNFGSDPAAFQKWQTDFQAKLGDVMQGTAVAGKKFEEVGTKYGLDPSVLK